MGIGAMTEIDYLLKRPFYSFFLAISAELGTFLTFPIANLLGFNLRDSASIAMIGGADGPIVIYTSITLSPELFVPITVVGYLYLSIVYALYPYMIKALIPKKMMGIEMVEFSEKKISAGQKFAFSGIICVLFSLLFPAASPLIGSFFLGVIIREAGIERYKKFLEDTLLSCSTLFLGFTLGTLLGTEIVLKKEVLLILILGIIALILSGLGGLFGGYILYKMTKGKINPVLGIAGVSCVPTTAKVAQKCVSEVNPKAVIIEYAMGANVAGVITTAIICACYISLLK
jgi:oxaloacetate decarboxylase beta subunit